MKTKYRKNMVYHIAKSGVDIHHNEKIMCGLCGKDDE